jgi:hypothetical protein
MVLLAKILLENAETGFSNENCHSTLNWLKLTASTTNTYFPDRQTAVLKIPSIVFYFNKNRYIWRSPLALLVPGRRTSSGAAPLPSLGPTGMFFLVTHSPKPNQMAKFVREAIKKKNYLVSSNIF